MKKLVKTLSVCGLASAMLATTAFAQYTFTLDEQGFGKLVGVTSGGQPVPITLSPGVGVPVGGGSSIQVDPISGQEGLFYDTGAISTALGVTSTTGDIVINEADGSPSDLIRFVNTGGLYGIFFFSLLDGDPDGLADVDTLPDATGNGPVITATEVGPEGNNGFVWRPTAAGQPGYVPQAPGFVFYNFISDAAPVPEPSTLALFGLAGGVLALFWRQRSVRA